MSSSCYYFFLLHNRISPISRLNSEDAKKNISNATTPSLGRWRNNWDLTKTYEIIHIVNHTIHCVKRYQHLYYDFQEKTVSIIISIRRLKEEWQQRPTVTKIRLVENSSGWSSTLGIRTCNKTLWRIPESNADFIVEETNIVGQQNVSVHQKIQQGAAEVVNTASIWLTSDLICTCAQPATTW